MPTGGFFGGGGWSAPARSSPNTGGGSGGGTRLSSQVFATGYSGGDGETGTWGDWNPTRGVDANGSTAIPRTGTTRAAAVGGPIPNPAAPQTAILTGPVNPQTGSAMSGSVVGTSSYDALTGIANTLYGPSQQLLNQQLGYQQSQIGLVNQGSALDSKTLRDNAGNAQAKLNLERGLVNGQIGNLDKLKALLGEVKANQLGKIGLSEAQAKDMAKRNIWDLQSQLTSRGAYNTIANERGTGRINNDLTNQLAQYGMDRQAADISYRQGMVGYDNQGLQLRNRLAGIGLDADNVANQLENGLAKIGLQGQVSINQIMQAMNGTNQQQANVASQILGWVMSNANLPPDVQNALKAYLTGGGGAQQTVPPTREVK